MLEQSMGLINSREENSCENIFASLIEILRKELTVYQELKSSIVYEKKILKKPTLDELNHNNARKENIILKARMLTEARTNVLKKITRNLDINTRSVKLSQLISYAGNEQRAEIEELRDALVLISQEITCLNETNKNLLNVSMDNVKSSLDFINSITSLGSVYQQYGKIKSADKNGIYLHKEG
jgi:hypothetical protein